MFKVWFVFVCYALFLAPGDGFGRDRITQDLIRGKFNEVDPLVVIIFMFLGLFPLVFAVLLLPVDSDVIPAWPFILGSFALGAFSLLPYFILRKGHHRPAPRIPRWLHAVSSSKTFSLLLILMALTSLTYLVNGFSLHSYWRAFLDSKLVSIMTVDFFILLWLSYYTMISVYDTQEKRWLSFIPVIGPLMLRWNK